MLEQLGTCFKLQLLNLHLLYTYTMCLLGILKDSNTERE
jgi:hypothetical protein